MKSLLKHHGNTIKTKPHFSVQYAGTSAPRRRRCWGHRIRGRWRRLLRDVGIGCHHPIDPGYVFLSSLGVDEIGHIMYISG